MCLDPDLLATNTGPQIEQAFKSFQKALKLQKDLNFDDANREYKELFKIELVSHISKPINSPNIRTLRYLAHRNRGLLHFEELRSKVSTLSLDASFELLLNSIEDLIISLDYTDGDLTVETLLLSLFQLIGNDRVSRFVIEYELSNEQKQDTLLHQRSRVNSTDYLSYLNELNRLLQRIGLLEEVISDGPELSKPNLSFLDPVLKYLEVRHEKMVEDQEKTLKLDSMAWRSIAVGLCDLVPKPRTKISKNEDYYTNCEGPITSISFHVPSPLAKSLDITETDILEEPRPSETIESADDEKKRRQEDVPQRSSKRVKEQTDVEPSNDLAENKFLKDFNFFLSNLNMSIDVDMNSIYSKGQDSYLFDFYSALSQWSNKHTDTLFPDQAYSSGADNSDIALGELFNLTFDHKDTPASFEYFEDTSTLDFIQKYTGCHYITVRNALVLKLLSFDGQSCPVTDFLFERELFNALEQLVLSSEEILFSQCSSPAIGTYSISVYEILLNRWIATQQQLKLRGLTSKQQSELSSYSNMIERILLRWKKHLNQDIDSTDEVLKFRFYWGSLLYVQHSKTSSIDKIKKSFRQLYDRLKLDDSTLNIKFPNYEFIPSLNLSTIKEQSDKFNVITSFEKTFNSDNQQDTVNLLKRVLFSNNSNNGSSKEEDSMIEFINEGSVNLRLKLWKVLLGHYAKSSNLIDYQKSFNIALEVLLGQLNPVSLEGQSEQQRQQILITALAFYCDFIEEFTRLLDAKDWKVADVNSWELFRNLLSVFRMLYVYILFEKSVKSTVIKNKSFLKFRDCIINTICAILPLYGHLTNEDTYIPLFNVFHEEVGELGFCDASNGRFLDLSECLLRNADRKVFEAEILQHLNCKFHISISSETFIPFEHGTKKRVFNKNSAFLFSSYILTSIRRKNYFFQSSFKQDLKHGLDVLYQTFGDPDMNDPLFQRNETLLDLHIDKAFDLRVFRDSLLGEICDEYKTVNNQEAAVYDNGLYYLEGILNLNLYKSRKKSGQSKNSDLEYIVKMLRSDLICGTNRIESWYCLGQAYAFQAEDDLTWTSDKLNTIDKKLTTAAIQRRSILCYLMCISLIVNNPSKVDDAIKAAAFGCLGRELYHSLMRPMDGFAFLSSGERKIMDSENGIVEYSYNVTAEKKRIILKFIYKILRFAISFDQFDWMNHFYFAKVCHKLGRRVEIVLKAAVRSCEKFPQGIEPHYYICSLAYKYHKSDKLDPKTGIELLEKAPLFKDLIVVSSTDNELLDFIIAGLKKLVQIDKKRWHHQPRTRISRIYYDLGEYQRSLEEIESVIVLKSTSKNLINIWKPEFEAPGKHFVYTTIYIDFYIKLSTKLADLQGLILFNRKLRRFGASMIDLPSAWDISCSAVCNLMKEIVRAEPDFTDRAVPSLIYSEFVSRSERISEIFKHRDLEESEIPYFVLLYETSEIRRMNNGFGSTSLTDDTFNAVYLKIYLPLVEKLDELKNLSTHSNNSTPSTPLKARVARRDILAVASSLCKIIEPKVKKYRISDEVGYEVPQDIIDKHSKPQDAKEKTPVPADVNVDQSYSNLHTPENKINNTDPENKINNTDPTCSVELVDLMDKDQTAGPKTPETPKSASKLLSDNRSDDDTSDQDEFHTPTEGDNHI